MTNQTTSTTHTVELVPTGRPGEMRRDCACGWQSRPFTNWRDRTDPGHCPEDPTVVGLETLQFADGGLFDAVPTDYLVHLVRKTHRGTPGPTLCGVDRFGKDAPGWSVGGGVSGGGIVLAPCAGCAGVARAEFAGLPVSGLGSGAMAAELGAAVTR